MTDEKVNKMKEISKKIHDEIETYLDDFMDKAIFELSELLDFECFIKDFIVEQYKELFSEEDADDLLLYIDVIVKVNLTNGSVGVHPGNLITALLFNSYYDFNIPMIEYTKMLNFKSYKTGRIMHYDRERNELLSIQVN
ncbi:MAG: hypothetical protein BWY04_01379 [candidate division CPR1 bacterium ADurb.Bin160]|uniref:Uncharacterized protein n=1 Tax=candidate division CPR1 bacterium ADurb.Bin160 TaxID=1852826 RepID=A0A1V5ZJF8_9BACT|nr:MAG: hypothetical protein BWY04_01379 [candidate division CPR1 bacterium ADurb.Bin160]